MPKPPLAQLAVPVGFLTFEVSEPAAAGRLLVAMAGPHTLTAPYLRRVAGLVHRLGCACSVRSYHPSGDVPARTSPATI
jgi:hypothetical protein